MKLKNERGFTLTEMLAGISIFTIVCAMAMPHLSSLSKSFESINARSYVIQDLKRAQAETITQGCRGIFKIATDGKSYTFGCDFLPYDTSVNPSADGMSFRRNMPTTVSVGSSAPVILNSRGQTVDIDNVLVNITLTLRSHTTTPPTVMASGTLLATGVFTYD